MRYSSNDNPGCGLAVLTFYLYWGIAWVVNLYKFVTCDFAEPFKDEIIHGIGVFMALPSIVTAWL